MKSMLTAAVLLTVSLPPVALASTPPAAVAQTTTFTYAGDQYFWSDPLNWDNGVPGPNYEWRHEAVRWWDHWLKDRNTGIMDEPRLALVRVGQHGGEKPRRRSGSRDRRGKGHYGTKADGRGPAGE